MFIHNHLRQRRQCAYLVDKKNIAGDKIDVAGAVDAVGQSVGTVGADVVDAEMLREKIPSIDLSTSSLKERRRTRKKRRRKRKREWRRKRRGWRLSWPSSCAFQRC